MYVRETLQLHSIEPDRIPQDAPGNVWNDGRNVAFRNQEAVRVAGDEATLSGSATDAQTVVFYSFGTTVFWVYANSDGIWAHDGSTETDITPQSGWSGTNAATFTSCVMGGICYINASDRDPVYWAGSVLDKCQPLPDWPANGRCIALRAHKSFLFAIGFLSEAQQRVRWSDAAEAGTVPQHWTPAPDNLAGFFDLTPNASPCLEGKSLRDSFVVYKNESIWSLDFIGGNAVFQARKMFSEHGIANTNALTGGIDDVHLFVSSTGDVMQTDGAQVVSVLDGRAQRAFYNDFTANVPGRFSAATLSREKLAFVIYPTTGQTLGNRALMYDFVSGDIGFRDMPQVSCAAEGAALEDVGDLNTWDGSPPDDLWDTGSEPWSAEVKPQTIDDVIVGGAFGFAMISTSGEAAFIDGPIVASLEKSGLAFGDPQRRKMINRVWPKITGAEGEAVQFRLGGQEVSGGPTTTLATIDFQIGQNAPIDCFIQGRFLYMEISSSGGSGWRLGSIDVEFRDVGAF